MVFPSPQSSRLDPRNFTKSCVIGMVIEKSKNMYLCMDGWMYTELLDLNKYKYRYNYKYK